MTKTEQATTQTKKWTYHKLAYEMRQLGWYGVGQGGYMAQVGDKLVQLNLFALDVSRDYMRELWHRYAENNEAPKPEDFA